MLKTRRGIFDFFLYSIARLQHNGTLTDISDVFNIMDTSSVQRISSPESQVERTDLDHSLVSDMTAAVQKE